MDAYFLPDTAATDYRKNHVKTTVAIVRVQPQQRRLGYFHNTAYHELEGRDFDGLFRIGLTDPADYLPPYCEFAKLGRLERRFGDELHDMATRFARDQLRHAPTNPMTAFAERLPSDMERMVAESEQYYHDYVFSGLRQCGANFELAAFFLEWLQRGGTADLAVSIDGFRAVSRTAKMLILKLARVARSKRPRDLTASVLEMGEAWARAMDHLHVRLGA
ncbi:MAG: DUF1839 family protein [Nannocystaceae bacterium]